MRLEAKLKGISVRHNYSLDSVVVFVAVAEAGSFSEASRRLGVSPSAVSQSIRKLEEGLGAPLFRRSTRSLRLTDVGSDYLLAANRALAELRRAAEEASCRGGQPSGSLRLTMARAPFEQHIAPSLVAFQNACPDVNLEITVEARLIDIVKEGYDAGVRYGNFLAKDMVAVPIAAKSEAILVASPAYFYGRTMPNLPYDLLDHRAVMCRSQLTGLTIPWTIESAGEVVQIVPTLATIVHDLASQIALTLRGMGILSAPATLVSNLVNTQILVHVLPAWSSPVDTLYLYFPNRRHQSAALRAFVEFLRDRSYLSQPSSDTQAGHIEVHTECA